MTYVCSMNVCMYVCMYMHVCMYMGQGQGIIYLYILTSHAVYCLSSWSWAARSCWCIVFEYRVPVYSRFVVVVNRTVVDLDLRYLQYLHVSSIE